MKTTLIISLGLLAFGCSAEKAADCRCTAKYTNVTNETSFYVEREPIDCETRQPIVGSESADVWFMGCVSGTKK